MANLNKVFLIGNLTRDPDLRYTPGGAAVCELGMAINRRYVTAGKEEKEETCFVDIVVWGKQAEAVSRYTRKGGLLFVEGRLQYDQWDDRESGKKRSKLRIVAERTQFLDAPGGRGPSPVEAEEGPPDAYSAAPPPPPRQSAPPARSPAPPPRAPAPAHLPPPPPEAFPADAAEDDSVDNIPF
jgi:single-strand DNA-binding protein